ncbi:hypothetical protein [Paenibacillus tarimensis]|uniref:hypothetical protein n=1 Tax=Paenibacillus tarimensis TaxID=416012 RepID=UPI001F312891|nr:hypothetical protein [Paenibacillus tarimensis]MCF2945090.1 hypothetical protein [Paenibacillus tarimensis]
MILMHPEAQYVQRLMGQVVGVTLRNGQYYIGRIVGVKDGELVLAGIRGEGRVTGKGGKRDQAQISGFLGTLLGGALGAPSAAGAAGGALPGMFGLVGRAWPTIKIGLGMLRYIWPLVGRFIFK